MEVMLTLTTGHDVTTCPHCASVREAYYHATVVCRIGNSDLSLDGIGNEVRSLYCAATVILARASPVISNHYPEQESYVAYAPYAFTNLCLGQSFCVYMNKYIITAVIGIVFSAGGLFYSSQNTEKAPITTEEIATTSVQTTDAKTSPTQKLITSPDVTKKYTATENVSESNPQAATTSGTVSIATEESVGGILIPIKVGEKSYLARVSDGATVLDAMSAASSQGLTYSGKQFMGLGLRVDEIDGMHSENGNYWFLYINGKSSDLGASDMTLKQGDLVEWRYQQSY